MIGSMFEVSKSFRIRSQVFSYGSPMGGPVFKAEATWQQLHLARANYLTVTASINGALVSAIIDTGATRSIVNAAWAQRLALPISGTASASALTRQVSGTLYRVAALGVGGVVVHNIDIASYDVSAVEVSLSRELPLLIGQDVLASAILEVDFPKDRVRLSNAVDASSIKAATKLPVSLGKSNLPHLRVNLEDQLQAEAIIDLGSNVLCSMSESFARQHGLFDGRPASTTMTVGAEGSMISQIFTLRKFQIGPWVLRDVPVCAVRNWIFSQPVNLGWPCFAAFRFVLDASAKALWLSADVEQLKRPIPRDRSGIGAARLPDRLLVRHVGENSPAARAGLREGDEIVAIDGQAVDRGYPSPNERLGEKPVGTAITMTLADGRRTTVILADYF